MTEDRVERETLIAAPWCSTAPGEDIRPDNSRLVEFTLSSEDDKARLRVFETRFGNLPTSSGKRADAVRFNTDGWGQVFDTVTARAEGSSV